MSPAESNMTPNSHKKTTDLISINRLRLSAIIGCWDEERRNPQPLVASIAISCNTKRAARTDALEETIDYDALSQLIASELASHSYRLLETAAQAIADICLKPPMAQAVTVTLEKPKALANADSASVTIFRRRP